MTADYIILGGGIAGLSLASFLDGSAIVIERDRIVGGLSRSFALNGIAYDIGPHIIFSKNKEVLDLHASMIPTNSLRRSNKILFDGRYIKYPFENDLSSLAPGDRDYCLNEFLNNPYEGRQPTNMLQFFLSLFGEGITRLYLQPYNEKIWKFDPSYMDLQMVERIPKPPREDVIASANGVPTEGYTHQLNFLYPSEGGFQSLIDQYRKRAERKGQIIADGFSISGITRSATGWSICGNGQAFEGRELINCMPLQELFKYVEAPADITSCVSKFLYNSIHIVMIQAKKDKVGDNFAIYVPDKSVIFHRLSKLNYLGPAYVLPQEGTTLMAEVTFRPGSYLSIMTEDAIVRRTISDLARLDLIDAADVFATSVRTEPYAYVIYDLAHRQNVDAVLSHLLDEGIRCAGRFAEFEYLNTDGVVERTLKLARTLNGKG